MIQIVNIPPRSIVQCTEIPGNVTIPGSSAPFPVLTIDQDSYITSMSIMSGYHFDPLLIHNFHIGKFCSMATDITMLFHMGHDYRSITTAGDPLFLSGLNIERKVAEKGQILVQNDVWIGAGATIMPGVTLHNGCCIATGSVVVKDVPPYAIVGGNPAKVLSYRFTENQIESLLKIAWWDWDTHRLLKNRMDFQLPVQQFIDRHLEGAEQFLASVKPLNKTHHACILLIPDVESSYPAYPRVIENFCSSSQPDAVLFIHLPQEKDPDGLHTKKITDLIGQCKKKHKELEHKEPEHKELEHQKPTETEKTEKKDTSGENNITLNTEPVDDVRSLFTMCDYFIAVRSKETIFYSCLADLYGAKILSGVDDPIFRENKWVKK